jgi:hypothetical protein
VYEGETRGLVRFVVVMRHDNNDLRGETEHRHNHHNRFTSAKIHPAANI